MTEVLDSGHVVTDEDVDTAQLIMELDRALGQRTDALTRRVATTLTMPSVLISRPARAKSIPSRQPGPSPLSHRISSSLPPAPPSEPDPSSWGAALVVLASPKLPPSHSRSDKSPSLPDDWRLPDSACSLKRRNARRARERAMANSLLNPRTAGSKARAIQEAQEAQRVVEDRAARSGTAAPPYDFLELIGKGSFGRVYKG